MSFMSCRVMRLTAAATVVCHTVAAFAAPGDIYDIGTLRSRGNTNGFAVNAAGDVTGTSDNSPATDHAFLYTNSPAGGGSMAELGVLNGSEFSVGRGINALRQVVGYSGTGGLNHAFLYTGTPDSGGSMFDLGTLGGAYSEAYGINDAGRITGYSTTSSAGYAHAFVYTGTPGSDGTMTDIGTLGGLVSYGMAINNAGRVVGSSYTTNDSLLHAFLYTGTPGNGGSMADLGTLGGSRSEAEAINASGQITGSASIAGDAAVHAFLYTGAPGGDASMADLGTLGGDSSGGAGINAAGQVVGGSNISVNGPFHAFLYTGVPGSADATMIDLDAWLDASNPNEGARWNLQYAFGITDTGLIAGQGTFDEDGPGPLLDRDRAFLLDASSLVPEPGAIALLALAAALPLRRGRRFR